MNQKITFLLLILCGTLTISAQTLFTYGGQPVDVKEFSRAYQRNNAAPSTNKEQSIRDYLGLFIKSKLKVREAYARGYDTLAHLKLEATNLRAQSIDKFMTDPTMMPRLYKEAFQRSQKDIHVAHIFVSFTNQAGVLDTVTAAKKFLEVTNALKTNTDFGKIADQYSDDPSVKTNHGDIGYITVFTLPWEFENAIYSTAPGKNSTPVRSKAGFHFFRNLGERKAVGRIKAQQILLAIPPGSDEATKKKIANRSDSLYKRIIAGSNFNQLASTFSNDIISAASGGTMPDIRIGEYDPVFENALLGLRKDGDVSKPFLTAHGWHILKRVSVKPVVTDLADKNNQAELEQRIMADARWRSSRDFIYNQVMNKAGFKKFTYDPSAILAVADSFLNQQPLRPEGRSITPNAPLLQIGNTTFSLNDFITYARTHRFKQDGTGAKPHQQVLAEWEKHVMEQYYRDSLETFNEEFRNLMTEFRDVNLFFEIMQQEVWNKAQNDTAALREIYLSNMKDYTWKKSADAIVFFCTDLAISRIAYDAVKKSYRNWRAITESNSEKLMSDSGRYEWSQIPNLNKMTPKAGMMTTPVVNPADNSNSFAYIVTVYPTPTQRTFEEARGQLINDYQEKIENAWNEELRKKYPVLINEPVLLDLIKKEK